MKHKITAKEGRYIKLGIAGSLEDICLQDGTLRIDYFDVPHEMGINDDCTGIQNLYKSLGCTTNTASGHATQIHDFYHCGVETLWITFAHGKLWWCFAKPAVEFISDMREGHEKTGSRLRYTTDGWHAATLSGEPLYITELNGIVTKTSGFRGTICKIQPEPLAYILRRINGEEEPVIAEARNARRGLLKSTENLIKRLQPKEFELFVDLVFANMGGRRTSAIGATQKDVDIEMMLPLTGQRAFAQVKCSTNQQELNHYVKQMEARDDEFMFYVYHTSRYTLQCPSKRVKLVNAEQLAEMTLQSGMFDWLIQKVC